MKIYILVSALNDMVDELLVFKTFEEARDYAIKNYDETFRLKQDEETLNSILNKMKEYREDHLQYYRSTERYTKLSEYKFGFSIGLFQLWMREI